MSAWTEFLSELCEKIDQRRPGLRIFSYEQIVSLLAHSKSLYHHPRTEEAHQALATIRDEGTFLLAADSLHAFLELFPGGDPPDAHDQPVPQGCLRAPFQAAYRTDHSCNRTARDSATPQPQRPPKSDAGWNSSAPIDPDKFQELMSETASIQSLLAARNLESPATTLPGCSNAGKPAGRVETQVSDLDSRHKVVLRELLQYPTWTLAQLQVVTSRQRLMPLACLDHLNKWSLNVFGDLLLEGDETITLNVNVKESIDI